VRRLGLLLLATACFAAEDVPGWVREAAARTAPEYPAKTPYVVLFQEEQVTVEPDGRQTTHERTAIRILQRGGSPPSAVRYYNVRTGRITVFQGWVLPPLGRPTFLGKKAIVESSPSDYTYVETRAQQIDPGSLEPGAVFAWEAVEEDRTVFTQCEYGFQGFAPALVSRFVLNLPPGWEAKATALNHAPIEPQVSGNSYTWELRDLPWIEYEEHSPDMDGLTPRLGVSLFPAPSSPPELQPLPDWSAVAAWFSKLSDPAAEPTEPVRAKAAELTAPAKTDWEKIAAIAGFVQKTNYVEVAINLSRGGGFTPRPAAQSLERNYGDCKDKTALMRALLKAVGIDSYAVSIQAHDRDYVRPEWASLGQFNHAIIAIRAPSGSEAPAVLDHARLGRLLLFDPTNKFTPLGDLPRGEQGSLALVEAGTAGELVRVPFLPSRYESMIEATMQPDLSLATHEQVHYFGQSAVDVRRWVRSEKPDELKKAFERGLARGLGGVVIDRLEPADRMEEGRLDLRLDLTVRQFGQLMQGHLLVVTPGALASSSGYGFHTKERKLPVRLEASQREEAVKLSVPSQFRIDELPDPVELEGPYGTYKATWKAQGGIVEFQQSVEVKPLLVPASDYVKVKAFFERIDSARGSAVVLVRQ
jgi:transglutaminase-like putative cysteine protease